MGDVAGLVGLGGGAGGTGFSGPVARDVIGAPIKQHQIDTAYEGTQNTLQSQQDLLTALQAQNGLSNQNQVYGQLQGIAAGTGPNPAQAMLNQTTGQNVANQAALMAGQRGAGANAGLMARQIGQQGAATQQQAGAQAAAMQAQQSLGAINQAGGMANTQAANQIGQTNANTAAQQAQYNALLNAQAQLNNANVAIQSNANSVNGQMANTAQQGQQGLLGGVLGGVGSILGFAQGGRVKGYDDGGVIPDQAAFQDSAGFKPQSKFGQFLSTMGNDIGSSSSGSISNGGGQSALKNGMSDLVGGIGGLFKSDPQSTMMAGGAESGGMSTMGDAAMMVAAGGGKVPALLSPGEKYLKPEEARVVAAGKASPKQVGKTVPGTPKYKGNNYANDVVPAKLEAGGVVIPNSIMQSKDPARGAADFVRKCLAKKSTKK